MTVSAKVRKSLPPSRLGDPKTGGYPMADKKHARIAKGFAAMHDAPNKASIDRKADALLAKKRGGKIARRQNGGAAPPPDPNEESRAQNAQEAQEDLALSAAAAQQPKKRGGKVDGAAKRPHLGRGRRANGGAAEPDLKAAYAAGQARRDSMSAEQQKAEEEPRLIMTPAEAMRAREARTRRR